MSLALPRLRFWRQWRRAEVTGAGGTGRKLVFWWRSCTQVRHAGGTCGAGGSEGGSPLSILLWEVVNGSYGAGRASGMSNDGRQPDGACLAGWLWFAGKPKVRRWFLCALSVLRSGRFAFGHDTVGLLIQRSAPSGAVAGRFM